MSFQMLLLLFFPTAAAVIIDESKIKEFKWRGPPVIDETIFTNPNSFDYDFNDDLTKPAELGDIYDQKIEQLPNFNVWKIGKDLGFTQLPIVTRAWQTWSTQANTGGPKDFFATPSTPVSPVFFKTQEPMTTTPMTPPPTTTAARTTTPTTTTERTTPSTSTRAPMTTTERVTIAETTTKRSFFQRERIVQQPPPAFKSGRGPIWRKGGRIEFDDSTAVPSTTPTPTVQHRNTFISFTRRPLAVAPGFVRNIGQERRTFFRNRQPLETTTAEATYSLPTTTPSTLAVRPSSIPLRAVQIAHTASQFQAIPKPVVIHHGAAKYRGPTYNCRVMNPFEDGVASSEHDHNCKMLYPGMSADGLCRCFYKVSGRDEHGCATGFLYACKPLYLHSVVV